MALMAEEPGFKSSSHRSHTFFYSFIKHPESRSCPPLVWETQSGVRLTATLREMKETQTQTVPAWSGLYCNGHRLRPREGREDFLGGGVSPGDLEE